MSGMSPVAHPPGFHWEPPSRGLVGRKKGKGPSLSARALSTHRQNPRVTRPRGGAPACAGELRYAACAIFELTAGSEKSGNVPRIVHRELPVALGRLWVGVAHENLELVEGFAE